MGIGQLKGYTNKGLRDFLKNQWDTSCPMN